ncbi:MAG TPA: heme ABC exporter ATP-binding protein CcmA [Methylomirabilota bacterium]|nr:heme ABC exporter ATP-binding protein CcmA [Methylomirabilota bacterium]
MISASHLRKFFGSSVVLEDLSLEVAAGQCVALLGPNGSGKTTLLRILATVLRPNRGRLALGGVDALKRPEVARALVGMVGHGSWVYEDLTALENLRFWIAMRGGDASPARLKAALQQLDLDAVSHERVRTFSAGMKRRLALARAALSGARILLLDEPFTGLDRQGRKWLGEFLFQFKTAGGAVLLATHSFTGGLDVADRITILYGGRFALDRPAAELSWDELHRVYDDLTDAGTR